jgi:hypothetical protein
MEAGRADISRARSASLRTSVKEALTSFTLQPAHPPRAVTITDISALSDNTQARARLDPAAIEG